MTSRSARALSILALTSALAVIPSGATSDATGTLSLGGRTCSLIPTSGTVDTGGPLVPVGTGSCPGVRPGAQVRTEKGSCTFNFLFAGSDGDRYIGTAGHCIIDSGERTWAKGSGPVARDRANARVGEFAYAVVQGAKDFALIRLDRGVSASASMCYFGGPTSMNADQSAEPTLLHLFGQGIGLGSVLPARTLFANTLEHRDHVFANGPAILGDSGAGVISSDGRALGVLVTGGVHYADVLDNGVIGITRIKPQIDRAKQQLNGITLTLQTAPF